MHIRQGKKTDAPKIARLLLVAMEEIVYRFIGTDDWAQAVDFLEGLVAEPDNQYAYQYVWVLENNEQIVGAALVYDGGRLRQLRAPVWKRLSERFGRCPKIEDETQEGEYYLDCLAIDLSWQGKGFGSILIKHLITHFVQQEGRVLGLLVDQNNPHAKRLYQRLGFKVVGEKLLMGKRHEHMQYRPDLNLQDPE